MLFSEGQKAFNKYMITHAMSEETIRGYQSDLNSFNRYMSEVYNAAIYIEDISSDDVEDYMYYLFDERELAARSRNRYLFSLRSFLNFAVKRRWVEFNVASEVDPVKIIEEKKVALTQEEIEELITAIEHPIISFAVSLLSYTGLRVKEAHNLKISDIDFEKNHLLANGKGRKQRYIPLAESFKPYLEDYLENIRAKKDSDYLLATQKTGKLSAQYINAELHRATKKLGWNKKVTCHALRRSFATNLLRKGANVYAISKLLGHASLKTTTLYLQLNPDELQMEVNKL